jgi:hypothetical protein
MTTAGFSRVSETTSNNSVSNSASKSTVRRICSNLHRFGEKSTPAKATENLAARGEIDGRESIGTLGDRLFSAKCARSDQVALPL